MNFKPERFLGVDGRGPETDPSTLSFGFGRRICPGRVLADSTIYLTVVQSLAAFNVRKAIDADGREIEPVVDIAPGIISHPSHFGTSIQPRSSQHEALIRSIEKDHPWQKSDSAVLERVQRD
jgi:hypothetical protein